MKHFHLRFVNFWITNFLLSIIFLNCKPEPSKFTIHGFAMGTTYTIHVTKNPDLENLKDLIEEELEYLENIFSQYRENSELCRFNKEYRIGKLYPVSREFQEVLELSLQIQEESKGAFSPILGKLVSMWGFGPKQIPWDEKILQCKDSVSLEVKDVGVFLKFRQLEFCKDPKYRPELDFSGIAKGYAIDKIMDLLRMNQYESAMVEIGGDLCVRTSLHDSFSWRIGIQSPKGGGLKEILHLVNGCVATSGNASQRIQKDGKEYTHILDPRTGYPLEKPLSSVTVIMKEGERLGARSDAWATALFVLGEENAKDFLSNKRVIFAK